MNDAAENKPKCTTDESSPAARPPITLHKILAHWHTITHHRHLVFLGCLRVGLIRQGLLHDLSKYSPSEFWVGVRYYQGTRSPNNAEREATGLSTSWLHHKGRNKHHYEYWLDYSTRSDGGINGSGILPCRMPLRYVIEMFMDRIAASKTYNGEAYRQTDALAYYKRGNTARFLHPDTARLLEELLQLLAKEGEEAAFARARQILKDGDYPHGSCEDNG